MTGASNVDASRAVFIGQINKVDTDTNRRDIGDWLSPLNFKLIQNQIFQTREEGTGQWLLECKEFQDWFNMVLKILWCPGMRVRSLHSLLVSRLFQS